MEKFDVVIAGAALNGLTAALALGGSKTLRPASVAIVDFRDPRLKLRQGQDLRASAITASSRRMFEALGVWQKLAEHAQNMTEIIVTDSRSDPNHRPHLLQFAETSNGNRASACMIENTVLVSALLEAVEASPNIRLLTGRGISSAVFGPGLAEVRLDNGEALRSRLVVAADGAKSPLRGLAHIDMVGWSYDQMGIVASFAHEHPHGGRAEEHFTPSGPFAILPLKGNRCSIVWTKRTADAQRVLGLSANEFENELQREVGDHLGRISMLGKAQGYPLAMFFAREFHGSRLALVGDAAHIIHPLAGLGLNLGFRDAAALAECVSDAQALGLDIGGAAVLERYTAWRRFDTVATAASLDAINLLFSNDSSALKLIRDFGLRATNQISALKNAFAQEAAGETGSLPKLLRGEAV